MWKSGGSLRSSKPISKQIHLEPDPQSRYVYLMSQLFQQLALGVLLIVSATAIQAFGIVLAMKYRPHVVRKIGRLNAGIIIIVMSAGALWMLAWQSVGVWVWALTLVAVDAFAGLEPALYFALASYTTLGFGDVLPPEKWRILGALIGANGMLGFGLATAALVALVEGIRDDLLALGSDDDLEGK